MEMLEIWTLGAGALKAGEKIVWCLEMKNIAILDSWKIEKNSQVQQVKTSQTRTAAAKILSIVKTVKNEKNFSHSSAA